MKDLPSCEKASADLLQTKTTIGELRATGWQGLSPVKKAFGVAYFQQGYSVARASAEAGISAAKGYLLERDPEVMAFVQDIQGQMEGIDTLNQQWVDSKIMELMPMVMGEVAVPLVDMKTGEGFEEKKFMPEIAVRLLEMKSPRKELGNAKAKAGVNIQINFGALGVDQPQPIIEVTSDDE